jgi:hypothetical protein
MNFFQHYQPEVRRSQYKFFSLFGTQNETNAEKDFVSPDLLK